MRDDESEETSLVLATEPIQLLGHMDPLLPLDQHPVAVYLARLSGHSRRTMHKALDRVAHHLSGGRAKAFDIEWTQVRYQHTSAVRTVLAENYSPSTANQAMAALRAVLGEAYTLGHMSSEDYTRAIRLKPIRGNNLPKGRALTQGELDALMRKCAEDKRPAGRRDAALIGTLYGCGLRRSELVALDVSDFHAASEEVWVRHGKGRKARVCHPPHGAARALSVWIERYRGSEPGPLFCRINKANQIVLARLTDQAVLFLLERRAQQAGVDKFSPHDMRRTFIGALLEAGNDISTVQQMAGHANVATTARYDRRGVEVQKRASKTLHVLFVEE